MGKVKTTKRGSVNREDIRAAVRRASEAIPYYYPVPAFVHHNPLHGFEGVKFEDALKEGRRLFGANEYPPEETFAEYLRTGKIDTDHLHRLIRETLDRKGIDGTAKIGGRELTPFDAVKASFEHKADPDGKPGDEDLAGKLSGVISGTVDPYDPEEEVARTAREDADSLGRDLTITSWCDAVLTGDDETTLSDKISTELITHCEIFFDEGHARLAMPGRDRGFYGAWRHVASYGLNRHRIKDFKRKLDALPESPEECVAHCLESLGVPEDLTHDYLTLHLASLPGWAGFVKWREDNEDDEWQEAYPAYLVEYMAAKLWYEKELADMVCRKGLGMDANIGRIRERILTNPLDYFFRVESSSKRVPSSFSDEVDRVIYSGATGDCAWKSIGERYFPEVASLRTRERAESRARDLLAFAARAGIDGDTLLSSDARDLDRVAGWMNSLSDSERGSVWLRSFEATYQGGLLGKLKENLGSGNGGDGGRPSSQSVYCIDVRSEPFRRHLESVGHNETFGFAGFFGIAIKFRAHGTSHETDLCPVIVDPGHKAREVPRMDQAESIVKHRTRLRLKNTGYRVLYDLKEDVVTPYVMVESLGWFYGVPLFGKTWFKDWFRRVKNWAHNFWFPSIKTVVTVDKFSDEELTTEEVRDILSYNQHIVIRHALKEKFGGRSGNLPDDFVEYLRLLAMEEPEAGDTADRCGFTEKEIRGFIRDLREDYRVDPDWASQAMSRIMQYGFTHEEQAASVEAALTSMGLTGNFARLVLFCAHGSTAENNPYEAALDCGACGGSSGEPNARLLASMANKRVVREALAEKGIDIPDDTHFVAGKHNTTTDEVTLYDMEDVPETHGADISKLREDLAAAGKLTSSERLTRLPDVMRKIDPEKAWRAAKVRSVDWSQLRPEWGLCGNAAFIAGRRRMTRSLDLGGRVFLQSYDYAVDGEKKALEAIMTAPQVVGQWINMEHFFSTVDNNVYGSGSKVYHNVTGRNALMYGTQSDLVAGLPMQSVMHEYKPVHEPVRLLSVIEAPREDIKAIIDRHEVLQNFYDNEWVYLVSVDPESGEFHRYVANDGWEPC